LDEAVDGVEAVDLLEVDLAFNVDELELLLDEAVEGVDNDCVDLVERVDLLEVDLALRVDELDELDDAVDLLEVDLAFLVDELELELDEVEPGITTMSAKISMG
jgi:hypothetical protein